MGGKRNDFIDYVKGVLIVLVTVGHAFQFGIHQDGSVWDHWLFKGIYLFHMPLFMCISGYLSYSGLLRSRFGVYVPDKLLVYGIPIVVWAVMYRSADFLLERDFGIAELPGVIVGEVFNSLWFIWALLGCLVITAAIRAIGRGFWIWYGISFFGVLLLPEYGNVVMLKFMYPYFQVGYLIASRPVWKLQPSISILIYGAALALVVGCYGVWTKYSYIYFSGMHLQPENFWNIGVRFVGGFAGSYLAFEALRLCYGLSGKVVRNGFATLGKDSIYIYILQGYVYIVIGRMMAKWTPPMKDPIFECVLGVFIGVLVAMMCWMAGKVLTSNRFLGRVLFGKGWK